MSTCATQQPWLEVYLIYNYNNIVNVVVLLCQNGANRLFLSLQTGKSIADDVDDLLAFSDPVPDPFSSSDIVGRGGVNQIE